MRLQKLKPQGGSLVQTNHPLVNLEAIIFDVNYFEVFENEEGIFFQLPWMCEKELFSIIH